MCARSRQVLTDVLLVFMPRWPRRCPSFLFFLVPSWWCLCLQPEYSQALCVLPGDCLSSFEVSGLSLARHSPPCLVYLLLLYWGCLVEWGNAVTSGQFVAASPPSPPPLPPRRCPLPPSSSLPLCILPSPPPFFFLLQKPRYNPLWLTGLKAPTN